MTWTCTDGDWLLPFGNDAVAAVWPTRNGARWWMRIGASQAAGGNCPDLATAKAAAESAARDYATAILAALPRPEPTAGEVEEVASLLADRLVAAGFHCNGAWRMEIIARAAIAAGLDPSRLKEGT